VPVPADRKAAAAPSSKDGAHARPEIMAPVPREPIVTERFSDTPHLGADGTTAKGPTQTLSEQILDSVRASAARGDNQVLVRLHPPELGTVLVRFREQEGRISGLLEVAESDTRQQLEQALPQVLRSLQEAGVEVQKLEVVTSGPAERELGRGHSQQEAWPQPQGWGRERDHPPAPSPARWWPNGESYPTDFPQGASEEQRADTTNGRIDVLL